MCAAREVISALDETFFLWRPDMALKWALTRGRLRDRDSSVGA
jgi:hypothetical protein